MWDSVLPYLTFFNAGLALWMFYELRVAYLLGGTMNEGLKAHDWKLILYCTLVLPVIKFLEDLFLLSDRLFWRSGKT